jgi:hypothetical protein
MSEWWTYRPSDFLMFSPRIYWRLVELYNRELWPAHLAAALAGVALLGLASAARPSARRAAILVLAAAWVWVGWAFHWQRYATINWAAPAFAMAFWVQAVLLVWPGAAQGANAGGLPAAGVRSAGWALAAAGLLYPLATLAAGRPWAQAESFGFMPDPTALVTLGVLWASGVRHAAWLSIVPLLWLVVGWTTLWLLAG